MSGNQLVNTTLSQLQRKPNKVAPVFLDGASIRLPAGGEVIYVKRDATATPLILFPQAGQTVDGCASYSLTVQNEAVHLKLIGSNWSKV